MTPSKSLSSGSLDDLPPDRDLLRAGLAFMRLGDGGPVSRADVMTWVEERLLAPGRLSHVEILGERGTPSVPLWSSAWDHPGSGIGRRLAILVALAQGHVRLALADFVSTRRDDRFLHALLFRNRLRRVSTPAGHRWEARPEPDDLLSDIVLSLFAADILSHRDEHEAHLGVCGVCGKVDYGRSPSRTRCESHLPEVP